MKSINENRKPLLKLKNDYVFKYVFSSPKARGALTDLLLSILDLPEDELYDIEIEDPNLHRRYKDDKACELDVKIRTTTGKVIDVELQMNPQKAFKERIVYYESRLISDQLSIGDEYQTYERAITIAITDFVLIKENDSYHNVFRYYDENTRTLFTDIAEIDILELAKLPKQSDGTKLWDWMRLIATEDENEMETLASKNDHMRECVMTVREMSEDEIERRRAQAREKYERDRVGQLAYARDEGLAKGLSEGRAEGRAEGLSEGVTKNRFENAQRMKRDNMDISLISKYTGLSIDQIKAL